MGFPVLIFRVFLCYFLLLCFLLYFLFRFLLVGDRHGLLQGHSKGIGKVDVAFLRSQRELLFPNVLGQFLKGSYHGLRFGGLGAGICC